jgi:ATP-dependent Clp protease ATP-binding subunit ClpC
VLARLEHHGAVAAPALGRVQTATHKRIAAAPRRTRKKVVQKTGSAYRTAPSPGEAKRPLGFTAGAAAPAGERMLEAAKRAFLPEFLNRIDEIVVFEPLTEAQVERIGELIWARIAGRLRDEHAVELEVEPALVARLAHEGFDPEFGARPLKRHIRRTLEKELKRAILDGRITDGVQVLAREGEDQAISLEIAQQPVAA